MNISFAVDGRDQIPTQGTKGAVRGCPFSLSSMLRLWSDRRRRRGVAARRIDGEQRDLWRDFLFQKAVWFVCSSLPNGRTYALCWG